MKHLICLAIAVTWLLSTSAAAARYNSFKLCNDGDEEFALKVELKDHPAMNDMDRKNVECEIAVLKRDDISIFPVEKVKFDVIFDFYNSTRGSITQALAEDIISDIEDADVLGKTFDEIYEVYTMLDSMCTVVSSTTGIMAGVSSVWNLASLVLNNIPYTKPAAMAMDNVVFPSWGMIGTINSEVITPMCEYLTCKNGGLIGGFGGESGLGEWLDEANEYTSAACTFSFESENGGNN